MIDRPLSIADLSVGPGQSLSGSVSLNITGVPLRLPLFLVNGAQPGPRLSITAGIHGAEYASIEAALRLGRGLDPEAVRGQVIIAPIANPPAFTARSIYVSPPDGKNLNRQFPGQAKGTFSQALAGWLFEEVIRPADAFIDLHGGDLIEALEPFVIYFHSGDEEVDRASRALACSFGIHYVVEGETPGSSYGSAAQIGIPGILAEAGGQGIWDEDSVGTLQAGVLRAMAHVGMIDPLAPGHVACKGLGASAFEGVRAPVVLDQWVWLRSDADGLFYPAVAVGTQVRAGQNLGRVADLDGNTRQSLSAPIDGTILFLVTALAMNAGDPLLALGN
jgi:hypothetical protein